tara:strand:+ start:758 stop:1036 length:279 start_codon:yes stop_codon:yes gene_type:complete
MIYSDYIATIIRKTLKDDTKIVSEVGYVDSSESNIVSGPFKKKIKLTDEKEKVEVTDKYGTNYLVTVQAEYTITIQETEFTSPKGKVYTYET